MTKVFLKIDASDKGHFEDFPKEKDESSLCHALLWSYFLFHVMLCFGHALLHFVMLLLTKSAPNTKIFSSTIDSPHFGDKKRNLLFTSLFFVTIHPLLFMTLFTLNFCLFKGGCPLCLKQVVLQVFFSRESPF